MTSQEPPHEVMVRAVSGALQHSIQAAQRAGQRVCNWAQQHLQPGLATESNDHTSSHTVMLPFLQSFSHRYHHHQQQQQQVQVQQWNVTGSCGAISCCPCSTTSSSAFTSNGGSSTGAKIPMNALVASLSAAAQMQPSVSPNPSAADSSAARKAELGRCTWMLLHMLAAQYPEQPTRQQKRDVREFVSCLTRIYPCGQCASHFMQIVKRDPPTVGNRQELQAWTCRVHNTVNRSLGKPEFNCDVAAARWTPLDCGPDDSGPVAGCDMTVGKRRWR